MNPSQNIPKLWFLFWEFPFFEQPNQNTLENNSTDVVLVSFLCHVSMTVCLPYIQVFVIHAVKVIYNYSQSWVTNKYVRRRYFLSFQNVTIYDEI